MKRVLLLNPPANPPVSRDYYCGHFIKGHHAWPPLDLLVMSGDLSLAFDVQVIDAVAERLGPAATRERVAAMQPDAVVAMTAAVSWSQDMDFLASLADARPRPILISGDYPRARPAAVLESNPCIAAVILDFADNDARGLLKAEGKAGEYRNLHTRQDPGASCIEGQRAFAYPPPRHELFPLRRYRMPQALHHPCVSILTDFGCPFSCDFCFMERIPHRLRDVSNVSEELQQVQQRGIRELFIADQSFGSHRSHALEVCDSIRDAGHGSFSWTASMRIDAADPELLQTMRAAGCHTLMFGVETPTQHVLDAHGKGTRVRDIEATFSRTRAMGFRRLAHFIIGLDGEDATSTEQLVHFAIALDPDIASFNIAAPAWNTSFGDHARRDGWLLDDRVEIAAPDALPVWQRPERPRTELLRLRNHAVRRFYMRPGYIAKQLLRVRTRHQLRVLLDEGIGILGTCLTGRA